MQSTQFHAPRDHIKHTIPHLQITLQFHTHGDNTKDTILRLWKAHEAHNSVLVEGTQSIQFHACINYITMHIIIIINIMIHTILQYSIKYNITVYTTIYLIHNITVHSYDIINLVRSYAYRKFCAPKPVLAKIADTLA